MTVSDDRAVPFQSLGFEVPANVLILAPHPDDFDAIAVTLRILHEMGNVLYLDVLTSGASGVENSFCDPPLKAVKEITRESEQLDSTDRFGLPRERVRFLHLAEDSEGHPFDLEENFRIILESLKRVEPRYVFMPHGHDHNAAHRRCWRMAARAAEMMGKEIRFFLNRDPKTVEMKPDVYTGFYQADADWKGQLLRCHRSQQQRNLNTRGHGFDFRILDFNRETAHFFSLPFEFAEVFSMDVIPGSARILN